MVVDSKARVSKFMLGIFEDIVKEYMTAMSVKDIEIYRAKQSHMLREYLVASQKGKDTYQRSKSNSSAASIGHVTNKGDSSSATGVIQA